MLRIVSLKSLSFFSLLPFCDSTLYHFATIFFCSLLLTPCTFYAYASQLTPFSRLFPSVSSISFRTFDVHVSLALALSHSNSHTRFSFFSFILATTVTYIRNASHIQVQLHYIHLYPLISIQRTRTRTGQTEISHTFYTLTCYTYRRTYYTNTNTCTYILIHARLAISSSRCTLTHYPARALHDRSPPHPMHPNSQIPSHFLCKGHHLLIERGPRPSLAIDTDSVITESDLSRSVKSTP